MRLLKILWQGRHVAALDPLRYTDDKFWEHLMKPLFEDIPQSLQEEDQEVLDKTTILHYIMVYMMSLFCYYI